MMSFMGLFVDLEFMVVDIYWVHVHILFCTYCDLRKEN